MFDYITKLVIGDMSDKKAYKQMMKKVDSLPEEYSFAFKKIQKYMYCVGVPVDNMTMFADLLDLFEVSAADGRKIIDVIGSDAGMFSDEFMSAYSTGMETDKRKGDQ
ncbi:DUF1048 domain-containing protein [Parasporobacterium paucivorans]|uniref:DNA-binding ferritin-like protein (Dps family) n=1 Tax=Parasporobacterium paucivorans DSM 15970 TaxID=1122934 RepID=A0A1M6LEK6_9FIRM|nr:DUF1048 domain-containing protein [Parasporobacterium paucivorans]SHJ69634.1 DNA-binding ferritin-like protein (Dps family) [Parasporobacterium paucivorans DSM 15970]